VDPLVPKEEKMKTKKITVKKPSMFVADYLSDLLAAGYKIKINLEEAK
jgi:hypothetical protein